MEWKYAVAIPVVTALGVGAVALQPRLSATARRWIAFPWWAATLVIVPVAFMGAGLGICAVLEVWGRLPLLAFVIGNALGSLYVRVAYKGQIGSF